MIIYAMMVAGKNMGFLELEHLIHYCSIILRAIACTPERDMHTHDDELILLIINRSKILFQPFQLVIQYTLNVIMSFSSVWTLALVNHIFHEYDMSLAYIERIIHRTKMLLIFADQVKFTLTY